MRIKITMEASLEIDVEEDSYKGRDTKQILDFEGKVFTKDPALLFDFHDTSFTVKTEELT